MELNKMIIQGKLTNDPVITIKKNGENELSIANFSIASNGRKKDDKQETFYINCSAFSGTAKFIESYFKKGSRILIIGKPVANNYTSKTGEKVYGIQLIVEEAYYAGANNGNTISNDSDANNETGETGGADESVEPYNGPDGFLAMSDDSSLPFNMDWETKKEECE